eukprot:TRINITY_DN5661_c0_g1_i1.p1 TRINITY_DN5661_c0_g1~~TRINITY_DN5661_c0_g1_i1.p1  ORF type:complete len:385 (+),score=117.17 TRINITY_DN5661_c0_g1_i1:858-2012(+)
MLFAKHPDEHEPHIAELSDILQPIVAAFGNAEDTPVGILCKAVERVSASGIAHECMVNALSENNTKRLQGLNVDFEIDYYQRRLLMIHRCRCTVNTMCQSARARSKHEQIQQFCGHLLADLTPQCSFQPHDIYSLRPVQLHAQAFVCGDAYRNVTEAEQADAGTADVANVIWDLYIPDRGGRQKARKKKLHKTKHKGRDHAVDETEIHEARQRSTSDASSKSDQSAGPADGEVPHQVTADGDAEPVPDSHAHGKKLNKREARAQRKEERKAKQAAAIAAEAAAIPVSAGVIGKIAPTLDNNDTVPAGMVISKRKGKKKHPMVVAVGGADSDKDNDEQVNISFNVLRDAQDDDDADNDQGWEQVRHKQRSKCDTSRRANVFEQVQ